MPGDYSLMVVHPIDSTFRRIGTARVYATTTDVSLPRDLVQFAGGEAFTHAVVRRAPAPAAQESPELDPHEGSGGRAAVMVLGGLLIATGSLLVVAGGVEPVTTRHRGRVRRSRSAGVD